MARRTALIVGAGDPAVSIARGLVTAGWHVHHVDDDGVEWKGGGAIDLVVHARYPEAARQRAEIVDLTAEGWRTAADEPLEAAIRLARRTHRPLAESHGTIVFLVPLMASAGGAGFAPLATAAEGVRILAKSLAKSWGDDGIRAHAITLDPSAFLSSENAAGMAEANSLHDAPLGHIPDLESEVARVIHALTGEDLAAVTGASLVVDGGLWMPG